MLLPDKRATQCEDINGMRGGVGKGMNMLLLKMLGSLLAAAVFQLTANNTGNKLTKPSAMLSKNHTKVRLQVNDLPLSLDTLLPLGLLDRPTAVEFNFLIKAAQLFFGRLLPPQICTRQKIVPHNVAQ